MTDIPPVAIAALAGIVRTARNELARQHRDGRSPWCPTCRFTADGEIVRGAP